MLCITEYNEEVFTKGIRAEGHEEGRAERRAEGRTEGHADIIITYLKRETPPKKLRIYAEFH